MSAGIGLAGRAASSAVKEKAIGSPGAYAGSIMGLANAKLELNIRRLSPDQLYRDATGVLLNPSRQTTGIVVQDENSSALPSSLPLSYSLQLAWWQLVAIIGGTVALFAAAYLTFMRQEVRA